MQACEKSLISVPILTPKGAEGGRLYFLPADLGIFLRVDETRNKFLEVLAPLPGANITPGGDGADPASVEIIAEAEQQFVRLLDYVCGTETSTAAFKNFRPFAVMAGGIFWASAVLSALDQALTAVAKNIRKPKIMNKKGRFKWNRRK